MKLFTFYFISLILIVSSCSSGPKEEVMSSFDNGKPEVVRTYPDPNDTLTFKKEVFYESGEKEYEGEVVNGIKEGVWRWWYKNGNKKDQCKYLKGIEQDTIFHWHENGNIKQVGVILEGEPNPDKECSVCCNIHITKYFEDGDLEGSYTKINDKLEGEYYEYDEEGQWMLRNYEDGILNGFTFEYMLDVNNNIMLIEGNYINGKEEGEWKFYDKDSVLFERVVYRNGEIVSQE